jgi:uncharacterized repeat protein (TIGR03806 family)
MAVFKSVIGSGLVLLVTACGSSSPEPSNSAGGAGASAAGGGGMPSASASAGAGGGALAGAGGSSGSVVVGGAGGMGGANVGAAGSGGTAGSGPTCMPPADVFSPITKLSQTGCVDPANPSKPTTSAVSYEVNSPLWSDSADKTRAFVLPAGTKIHVRDCTASAADCPNGSADDGRWAFPVGSVMIKTFAFDGKLVETRLFMHVDANNWIGYSYQWDEAQTEATLVDGSGAEAMFNTQKRLVDWHYPSQKDCLNCHNNSAGSTLGPETAQLNRTVAGMNQIDRLSALGLFETAPAKPYKAALVAPYPGQPGDPASTATTEQKARSYLHANCGFCHRPGGNFANFDLRNDTAIKDMKICNVESTKGAIENDPGKTKILVPGKEMDSLMWLRMNEPDPQKGRMPQVASFAVDQAAVGVVGDWIKTLTAATCPPSP